MSGMGYFYGDAGANPEDVWKQRMAMTLMGNQNNHGAMGGLANAGSALAGAYAMKQLQDPTDQGQKFMRERMSAAGTPMESGGWLGKLFSLGGGV